MEDHQPAVAEAVFASGAGLIVRGGDFTSPGNFLRLQHASLAPMLVPCGLDQPVMMQ